MCEAAMKRKHWAITYGEFVKIFQEVLVRAELPFAVVSSFLKILRRHAVARLLLLGSGSKPHRTVSGKRRTRGLEPGQIPVVNRREQLSWLAQTGASV